MWAPGVPAVNLAPDQTDTSMFCLACCNQKQMPSPGFDACANGGYNGSSGVCCHYDPMYFTGYYCCRTAVQCKFPAAPYGATCGPAWAPTAAPTPPIVPTYAPPVPVTVAPTSDPSGSSAATTTGLSVGGAAVFVCLLGLYIRYHPCWRDCGWYVFCCQQLCQDDPPASTYALVGVNDVHAVPVVGYRAPQYAPVSVQPPVAPGHGHRPAMMPPVQPIPSAPVVGGHEGTPQSLSPAPPEPGAAYVYPPQPGVLYRSL